MLQLIIMLVLLCVVLLVKIKALKKRQLLELTRVIAKFTLRLKVATHQRKEVNLMVGKLENLHEINLNR